MWVFIYQRILWRYCDYELRWWWQGRAGFLDTAPRLPVFLSNLTISRDWATSMASLVSQTDKVVIGYSRISGQNSLIHEIQQIDFLGIMAANAGLLTNGIVCSGSGQNLGYKKKDFFNIGGFEEVKHRESGDDMYIVQKISKIKGATFNYDKNSFVTTLPKNSLSSFINQRIRWSSNSKLTLFTSPLFFCF